MKYPTKGEALLECRLNERKLGGKWVPQKRGDHWVPEKMTRKEHDAHIRRTMYVQT